MPCRFLDVESQQMTSKPEGTCQCVVSGSTISSSTDFDKVNVKIATTICFERNPAESSVLPKIRLLKEVRCVILPKYKFYVFVPIKYDNTESYTENVSVEMTSSVFHFDVQVFDSKGFDDGDIIDVKTKFTLGAHFCSKKITYRIIEIEKEIDGVIIGYEIRGN